MYIRGKKYCLFCGCLGNICSFWFIYRELSKKNRCLQRTERGFQCANSLSVSVKNLVFKTGMLSSFLFAENCIHKKLTYSTDWTTLEEKLNEMRYTVKSYDYYILELTPSVETPQLLNLKSVFSLMIPVFVYVLGLYLNLTLKIRKIIL